MSTPTLTVRELGLYEWPVRLRMPFRCGVVTLTEAPQCFVRARIEREDGMSHWGAAVELLAPKWFDKNLALSNEDNFDQLRLSLALAADAYTADCGARGFRPFRGALRRPDRRPPRHRLSGSARLCQRRMPRVGDTHTDGITVTQRGLSSPRSARRRR